MFKFSDGIAVPKMIQIFILRQRSRLSIFKRVDQFDCAIKLGAIGEVAASALCVENVHAVAVPNQVEVGGAKLAIELDALSWSV